MPEQTAKELIFLCALLVLIRILYLIHKIVNGFTREASIKRTAPCKTLICIGSGGHTTEMLNLVENLDFAKYTPRYYVMATSDTTSRAKVDALEESKRKVVQQKALYEIHTIPRSRIVHQSYLTSIFTTIYSILCSVGPVLRLRPDLVLCNGPGTCVPICLVAFLLKVLFISDIRVVFVESFCRTRSFSQTGKILKFFADNFVVQWPSLKKKMKRTEYIGPLM